MNITREEANRLKDKFYAATATPEEERLLARLLRSEECPEEWADERRALLTLLPDETGTLPEGFSLRLAQRLKQERIATRRTRQLRLLRWAAAAMITVFMGGIAVLKMPFSTLDEQPSAQQKGRDMQPETAALSIAKATPPKSIIPQVAKKAEPTATLKPKRKRRNKPAPSAVTKKPSVKAESIETDTGQQSAPAAPDIRTATDKSLHYHVQRTMQSRDRLIAEARNYLASSCLNRNMSAQEIPMPKNQN